MLHQFDHRFGDYRDQPQGSENTHLPDVPLARLQDPNYTVTPRYWVPESEVAQRLAGRWDRGWLLATRMMAPSTNERTWIGTVLTSVGLGNSAAVWVIESAIAAADVAALLANLNSFAADFAARKKVGGSNLNFFYVKQFPVLPPEAYAGLRPWGVSPSSPRPSSPARGEEGVEPAGPTPDTQRPTPALVEWIAARVLELTYTAWDLQPFARDLGYEGPPFVWDEARRFLLCCELDAAFFHLYGIARDDVDYILETFPIVKRKDLAAHGRYRTKETILQFYDALARAMRSSEPYQTRLDPPPTGPRVAPEHLKATDG